jgi:hypothetical protein
MPVADLRYSSKGIKIQKEPVEPDLLVAHLYRTVFPHTSSSTGDYDSTFAALWGRRAGPCGDR